MPNVTKEELMLLADYISNEYVQDRSKDLNQLVANAAIERGFNEHQVAALVNEVNRAVFQKLFSVEEDKRFEFPLVSTNEVLKLMGSNVAPITFLPTKIHETENLHVKGAALTKQASHLSFTGVDPRDFDLSDVVAYEQTRALLREMRAGREKLAELERDDSSTQVKELFAKANEFEHAAKEFALYKTAAADRGAQIDKILGMLKAYNFTPSQLEQVLRQNGIPEPVVRQVVSRYKVARPAPVLDKKASVIKEPTLAESERLGKAAFKAFTKGTEEDRLRAVEKIAEYSLQKVEEDLVKLGFLTPTNAPLWEHIKELVVGVRQYPEVDAIAEGLDKLAEAAATLWDAERAKAHFLEKAAELNEECMRRPEFAQYCHILFEKYKSNLA